MEAIQDVSTRNDTATRAFPPVMVCSILHLEDNAGHNELLLTTVLSGLMGLIQPQNRTYLSRVHTLPWWFICSYI